MQQKFKEFCEALLLLLRSYQTKAPTTRVNPMSFRLGNWQTCITRSANKHNNEIEKNQHRRERVMVCTKCK